MLSAELQAPSEGEKVDKFCNAQQTKASAQSHKSSKCCNEILNCVDNILVILNYAFIFEIHVQHWQILLNQIL